MALSKAMRSVVFAKYEGRCGYCGTVLVDLSAMQADHMHPKQYRGTDDLANLMPACRPCNNYKGVWTVDEFRAVIAGQLSQLRKYSMNFRTAERFGLVTSATPERIVFYYERQDDGHCNSCRPDGPCNTGPECVAISNPSQPSSGGAEQK